MWNKELRSAEPIVGHEDICSRVIEKLDHAVAMLDGRKRTIINVDGNDVTVLLWAMRKYIEDNKPVPKPEPPYGVFATRLKTVLDLRGMTQRELAEKTGITEVSISRYINGSRIPRGPQIAFISEVLKVTTDFLLGLED